jgi:hypothetical protein
MDRAIRRRVKFDPSLPEKVCAKPIAINANAALGRLPK